MTESMDRRATGVNRVTVARVVDICGRDPGVPAFEAESVELSGRGMHVRTPYLPPLGAPLVCRLDHDGREIVVEGVVAWQADRQGGGEFGIQFTALDSGSVEALKSLCGLDEKGPVEKARAAAAAPAAPEESRAPAGAPVKLHIEGLGAPMKARVRDGGTRRLQVGSNLEFLKVGRGLEVEDVEHGDRRGARIDAVSIAIDPETQVPQLVVVLRYDGQDTTPEPSVVDDDEVAAATVTSPREGDGPTRQSAPKSTDEANAGVEDTDDADDEAAAFRGRVDAFAVKVGKVMQHAGSRFRDEGGDAASRFLSWAKASGGQLGEMAARRAHKTPKRVTAPAPVSANPGARKLRPQNGETQAEASGLSRKKKIVLGASAGGALTLAVIAFAVTGGDKSAQPGAAVAAGPVAAPAAAPTPPVAPVAANPAAPVPAGQGHQGVIANVPLFGPTPMATLEPAPLGPSPEELARAGQPLQGAANGASRPAVEERMDDSGNEGAGDTSAADESFDDADRKRSERADDSKSESRPEDAKPWVSGKLHLPIVHRIQLDKPGAAIKGTAEASGFSVVIPGRKALETGAAIAKRDDRIASVKTSSVAGGAKVTFAFRGKVPGYKVRLKSNYVEFFISSPGGVR